MEQSHTARPLKEGNLDQTRQLFGGVHVNEARDRISGMPVFVAVSSRGLDINAANHAVRTALAELDRWLRQNKETSNVLRERAMNFRRWLLANGAQK